MSIERLRALEKKFQDEARVARAAFKKGGGEYHDGRSDAFDLAAGEVHDLIAELGQEVGAVSVSLTDGEHEWLTYAVDHMLDDSEPEDKTCARVLQGLLDRCVVTSNAQLPHPLGERHAAIEKALKGQTLLLMSRDHVNDQKKPLAEIKYGMSTDLGVLFCLADTKAPMPVDTSPAHTSEARDCPAQFFASGPQGDFFTADSKFANHLILVAGYDRDDWTVTDLYAAMRQEGGTP